MDNSKKRFSLKLLDFKIAFSIALCMLTYYCLIPGLQVLGACTAALMCCQDTDKMSIKSGITRVLGTVIGGIVAVLVVLADNAIGNTIVFVVLSFVGIVVALFVFRALKFEPMPSRVGCITVILVLVVLGGNARISYAVSRVIATVFGAVVAVIVSTVFNLISNLFKGKKAEKVTK